MSVLVMLNEEGEIVARSSARFVRRPFSRFRVLTEIQGESKTHQSHAAACDINLIVARYERTGELPPAHRQGAYADVTQLQGDLTERAVFAQETIAEAKKAFKAGDERRREEAEKKRQADIDAAVAEKLAKAHASEDVKK